MLVGVFGISGVGKTTFSKRFVEFSTDEFHHLSASDLIKNFGGYTTPETLEKVTIDRNQQLLKQALENYKAKNPNHNLILDLHIIIESPEGTVKISKTALQSLNIDIPVFLQASPSVILKRRESDTSRARLKKDVEELDRLQKISKDEFGMIFGRNSYHYEINEVADLESSVKHLLDHMSKE